jgi:siroheme synthase
MSMDTVDTMVDVVAENRIIPPALRVLGEVVSLHPILELIKRVL